VYNDFNMEGNPFEAMTTEYGGQRFEKAVARALEVFELPDYVQNISYDESFGPAIRIVYSDKKDDVPGFKVRAFFARLQASLAENNLELGSLSGSGGNRETYMVNELVVDGGTNWRRWLPYPEKFDEEIGLLLDEAAQKVGQQTGGDSYAKFYHFLDEAERKGMLSKEEVRLISSQMNRVAHV